MYKRRVNVRGVIYLDGKVLAVRHKKYDGKAADYWAIPGGGLDPRENLKEGIERELFEETGIKAEVGHLMFVQQFAPPLEEPKSRYDEKLEFFFLIKNADDFANIDLAKTSHGLEEIADIKFIDPKKEHVKPGFLSEIDLADYTSQISPVYFHTEFQNFN